MFEPTPRAERNAGLDGLRGIAALSVALGHCVVQVTGVALWSTSLGDFPSMPAMSVVIRVLSALFPSDAAVMLFFVLSGHVLWSSFRRKKLRFFADLPDYACARVYRLFPLTIVSALPLGLLTSAPAGELVSNMLLLSNSLNGVLWSLQVEVVASFALFAVGCDEGRWLEAPARPGSRLRGDAVLSRRRVCRVLSGVHPWGVDIIRLRAVLAQTLGSRSRNHHFDLHECRDRAWRRHPML